MSKNRLEAFSDGVLAIIITIMVLELKVPHAATWGALLETLPVFLSYVLSFLYIAIYWNNHHHLLHTSKEISGPILWANNYLLFWLSLIPFVTAWAGENHFQPVPVAVYSGVLFMAAVAYWILTLTLIALHGPNSLLANAVGKDVKGKISIVAYAAAVPIALWKPSASLFFLSAIAVLWLVPDRRIEKSFERAERGK